ncbi:DUF2171 domain-containing protein [Myxococcaceae bacterium GXIMD 01537]
MVRPGEVREAMTVFSADGRKLGTVTGIGETHFEMEPPGVLPVPRRDYLVEYEDVAYVAGEEVCLVHADHPLLHLEVDDDGGALPPRHHRGMDAEPVNAEPDAAQP